MFRLKALAGVIQELLELAEKVEKAQTPVVDYSSKEGRQ